MKRTVFHISKTTSQNLMSLSPQSPTLFPYLDSKIVDQYSKSIIRYKRIHASCTMRNINEVVPLPAPSKEFIFFGRSNVGKSTLLNRLMQCDVAEVSKRPGKTKDLLFCEVGSNSLSDQKMIESKIYFVDAPGYGYATGVSKSEINKWGKLITTFLQRTKDNSLQQRILCLLDISHGLKQTDALIFQLLKSKQKQFMLIFTKCDKLQLNSCNNSDDLKQGLETAALIQSKYQEMNFYVHFTSSRIGLGIDQLRKHIMFEIVSGKI